LLLPTLPIYIKQQGISESQVGLVIGIFTLAAVAVRTLVGGLLDRYGRRIFMIAGLFLFAIAMCLYNWVSGLALLLLLRIFHGLSWAASTTAIGTSITDIIPAGRRGEGMGWYGLAMTISMGIGPIMGVWIVQDYSFQTMFFLAALLTVAALLLAAATKVPFTPNRQAGKIEFFDRSVLSISVAIFFLTITYGGITTYLPLFTESIRVNAGTFFLVYAITLTVTRPLAGRLSDRYGERVVTVPALIAMIAALLVLSFSNGWFGVMLTAILYGIGFGAAQPIMQAVALRLAPAHKQGVANASFFTAFDLGIGLGALLLGPVSQYFGYTVLFIVCAASAFISLLIFHKISRREQKQERHA